MNIFNLVIDTWSRFLTAIYDFGVLLVSNPIDALISMGTWMGELVLLILFIVFFFSFTSGLYGSCVCFIRKLASHPSEYTEYTTGDTRKCLLLTAISAGCFYLTHLVNMYFSPPPELQTLGAAVESLNNGLTAVGDSLVIICTILPFALAYILVNNAYAKYDAANAQQE